MSRRLFRLVETSMLLYTEGSEWWTFLGVSPKICETAKCEPAKKEGCVYTMSTTKMHNPLPYYFNLRCFTLSSKYLTFTVVPVHSMAAYTWSRRIVPVIFNLDFRWCEWSASRPGWFTPWERVLGTHWRDRLSTHTKSNYIFCKLDTMLYSRYSPSG
jgi:hypothetical protein